MTARSRVVGVVLAAAALALVASPASAAGQTERGPEHANSLCSYSGLNDDPAEAFPDDGRTQTYGQLVRKGVIPPSLVRNGEPSPGTLCNGHLVPLQDMPEEPPA
ncbi:hypothetical protein [Aquipuribacter sp. SD81]|uniref:hypothetical protein n=1 Tax=Aquipuribacter sp. SD81 TaxID=3127703 RepID=UPI00301631C0